MSVDLAIVDLIHKFFTDREIFDIEAIWLVASLFTACAPPKVTEKIPSWIMKSLNVITLHWSNSKNSDIRGKRKW